jgi:hypothetical protein
MLFLHPSKIFRSSFESSVIAPQGSIPELIVSLLHCLKFSWGEWILIYVRMQLPSALIECTLYNI